MLTSPVALLVGAAVIAVTVAVVNRKRISTLLWGDEEGEYQRELLQYAKTHAAQLTRQSKRLKSSVEKLKATFASSSPPPPVEDDGPTAPSSSSPVPAAVTSRGQAGYYFFDSKGKRLPNKWDTFDVDEALREVESSGGSSTKPSRDTKSSLTRQIQQHTLDVEAFLTELDEIRGDETAKSERKRQVSAMQALIALDDELLAALQ